jgi:hypothetical protein
MFGQYLCQLCLHLHLEYVVDLPLECLDGSLSPLGLASLPLECIYVVIDADHELLHLPHLLLQLPQTPILLLDLCELPTIDFLEFELEVDHIQLGIC